MERNQQIRMNKKSSIKTRKEGQRQLNPLLEKQETKKKLSDMRANVLFLHCKFLFFVFI